MLFSLPSWDYFQCKSLLLECAVLIMTQKLLWLLLWGMISFCSNAQRNVLLPNCCSSQLICLFPQCQVQWGIPALGFIYLPEAAWGPWEGLVWGEGPPALLSSGISLAPLPQLWGHWGVPNVGRKAGSISALVFWGTAQVSAWAWAWRPLQLWVHPGTV